MRSLVDRRLSDRTYTDGVVLADSPAGHWVASDLSSSPVSSWPDRSGNSLTMTQATGAAQPTLTANAIAGRPAVTFDGSDDYLLASDIAQLQPFAVFGVVRHHNADTNQRGFFGGNAGGAAGAVIYTEGGVWRMFAGSGLTSTIPVDAAWHVVVGWWLGGGGTLAVDTDGAGGAVNTRRINVPRIGGYGDNASNLVGPWDGDIAEVVFYDRSLSVHEIDATRVALGRKYGLA